eukprot:165185-Prymnesium_polylepis.3
MLPISHCASSLPVFLLRSLLVSRLSSVRIAFACAGARTMLSSTRDQLVMATGGMGIAYDDFRRFSASHC